MFFFHFPLPRWKVTTLLHEGSEWEPKTVANAKIVGDSCSNNGLFPSPLIRAESTDQEKDDADPDVGKDNAHPYLAGQWTHEGKNPRFLFHWFFDHDTNSQTHERFGKVYNPFPCRCDGQRCNGHVSFLKNEWHSQWPCRGRRRRRRRRKWLNLRWVRTINLDLKISNKWIVYGN